VAFINSYFDFTDYE
jgi:hypothetical protein